MNQDGRHAEFMTLTPTLWKRCAGGSVVNTKWIGKRSLRAAVVFMAVLLISVVLSLSAFLVFGGVKTQETMRRQHALVDQLELAMNLDRAIDLFVQKEAALFHDPSEQTYRDFIASAAAVDAIAQTLNDEPLRNFVKKATRAVVRISLEASEAYQLDDMPGATEKIAAIRAVASGLESRTQAKLSAISDEMAQEEAKVVTRNSYAIKFAIVAGAVATLICIIFGIVAWVLIFRPIERFIAGVSNAAADPLNAKKFVVRLPMQNEVGAAGSALNRLLVATSDAIADANIQAANAEQSEIRWQGLFNESPDAIMVVDPDTFEFIDENPAAVKMLCLHNENASRRTAMDIFGAKRFELRQFVDRALLNGHARCDTLTCSFVLSDICASCDRSHCSLDDRSVPVSMVGISVPHQDRQAILLHIRDISAQRDHEADLEKARLEAENANEAKSNFLANMSHEIRTPLNGILGMAEALRLKPLRTQEGDMVETILESGKVLTTILNDVLDLSKIEAGHLQIQADHTTLHELVASVHRLFVPVAEEKGLNLTLGMDAESQTPILADGVRVRQCLSNLVSNAIKFTPKGSVNIDVSCRRLDSSHTHVGIQVTDTGPGIPEDIQEKLFRPFMQGDESSTRGFGGTGLGLTISRRLARAMGGDITVQSRLHEGSRFTFTFYANIAEIPDTQDSQTPSTDNKPDLAGLRALLVDDNKVNRMVAKTFLQPHGVSVVEVENGQLAIDALENEPFDFVLMDIHMPVMDGVEATKRIRESDQAWHNVPIFAMTADAMSDHRAKYLGLGMDGYISKPIDPRLFLSIIESVLSGRLPPAEQQSDARGLQNQLQQKLG